MASTEAKVGIRPMKPEDIDAVLAIDRQIIGVERAITYDDLIHKLVGGQIDLSFVAEVDGQVVGFVLGWHTYVAEEATEACDIRILGVAVDYWRQGIGSKLIQALLEKCHSKGIKMLRVMVEEGDSQLQGFFEHIGFCRGHLIEYSISLSEQGEGNAQ